MWRLKEWFPAVELKKFGELREQLLRFNSTLNLVSAQTIETADETHFADSILAWFIIQNSISNSHSIFDFGAGNGFPGLVMAILSPQSEFVLVDKDQRKAEYMMYASRKLELTNVKVECLTVDQLPSQSVHTVVSRGFASLTKSLLLGGKVFASDAMFYHMKGEAWSKEAADLPPQLFRHWKTDVLGEYELPASKIRRTIVTTQRQIVPRGTI